MDPATPKSDDAELPRLILLVGFMGSGKTTVGALLAEALSWSFSDLDREVVRRDGREIATIFSEDGEGGFRDIEHQVAKELLRGDQLVLSSGGGWPCRDDRLAELPEETLTIWLRVSPEAALARTRGQAGERPLLEVEDPLGRARVLLAQRAPHYGKAKWWVDTERQSPTETVRRVVERLRTDPGRPLRDGA